MIAWIVSTPLLFSSPALAGASPGDREDWPCFRGPRQDGISRETGLLTSWPGKGLKELWRIDLGSGFSSFAAVGGRLYTLAERAGRQEAVCLEASSGREIFRQDLEEGFPERQGGDGPRATPTVGEGLVFALGARGALAALDAESGKPRWRIKLLEKFRARNLTWGLCGSPLLEGGRLIVAVGAGGPSVVALKPETGEVLWRADPGGLEPVAGYSTPYAITHAGRRQVVVFLG